MKYNIIFLISLLMILASCESTLSDKEDLTGLNEDIFTDSTYANYYLNQIYERNLPNWPSSGTSSNYGTLMNCTDECYNGVSEFFQGNGVLSHVGAVFGGNIFGTRLATSNSYGKILVINQYLQEIEKGGLNRSLINRLKGQVYFFRAWRYFEMVSLYGGVPIVLDPINPVFVQDQNTLKVRRNKTSECMAQICADLDSAIRLLPGTWYDLPNNWGRITSGAAAAFKGRVLLYYASPQFNPQDLPERWQAAYDANLLAKTILDANGYGLRPSFDDMWFTENGNSEAVLVTCYNNSSATSGKTGKNSTWDNATRPSYLGTGAGSNQPTKQLVDAFPMKDGKKIGTSSKYTYDENYFFRNRDPRFDKTIAFNGCTWYINGNPLYRLWTYYVGATTVETTASRTGFYCRKAVDRTSANPAYNGTDWMEIRYAEVLLNLAESACGIGKLQQADESYAGLIAIRKRAGIDAGADDLYGLDANMSRTDMFKALLWERQIEFAFEGKRFWDLRRWKLFESILNNTSRTGVTFTYKTSGNPAATDFVSLRDASDMISNPTSTEYIKYFTATPKTNIETTTYPTIQWRPIYYFFGLPQAAIDNNPNLEQTQGWNNGTFDPLQ